MIPDTDRQPRRLRAQCTIRGYRKSLRLRRSKFERPAAPSQHERGFALLIVLWALVFITLLITRITATERVELSIAGNLMANAQARAAADGAIYEAIFRLSDPRPDQRWMPDLRQHKTVVGDSAITLAIADEAGRINPNLASPALVAGLLQAVGTDPEVAAELSQSIGEWVGSIQLDPATGDSAARYKAAGLDYAPPAAPLESLDELALIQGITPALLASVRHHLTLFGPADVNPASADPVVAAALSFANGGVLPSAASTNNSTVNNDLRTVRIRATATGPNRAKVTRIAIVRMGDTNAQGYTPLSWQDGE